MTKKWWQNVTSVVWNSNAAQTMIGMFQSNIQKMQKLSIASLVIKLIYTSTIWTNIMQNVTLTMATKRKRMAIWRKRKATRRKRMGTWRKKIRNLSQINLNFSSIIEIWIMCRFIYFDAKDLEIKEYSHVIKALHNGQRGEVYHWVCSEILSCE